jgi:hydrogenase nickel incorporation protein HypA/HybF
MHELSIVMSILDIAGKESARNNATLIEEIELEIGELSGIDRPAFDFAWQQAIRSTQLEKAVRTIHEIPGEGKCLDCGAEFPLHQLYDPCPSCGEYLIDIKKGKELRVRSLVVS